LFKNNTAASLTSNSTLPISIVAGAVTPNGTQVSWYGNISKVNHTRVDGNMIFDIDSITKTFAAVVLTDMVKQGLVKFDHPLEKFLPANVIVQSFNEHKLTLENPV
jgi:serine-type D-Ala-D-Ala carboxypeptidase/endopeptidase